MWCWKMGSVEGEVGRLFCSVMWVNPQKQQSPHIAVRASFCMVRHQESKNEIFFIFINRING